MPSGVYKHHPHQLFQKGQKQPTGKNHPRWKGGKTINSQGYVLIKKRNHPFCDHQFYVRRSHLVMEKILGRYLKPEEIVHHKGIKYPIDSIKNKQDDRPENLQLFANNSKHTKFHSKEQKRCHFCGRLIKKGKICHPPEMINRHYQLYGKSIQKLIKEFKLSRATIFRRLNANVPLSAPKFTHKIKHYS